MAFFSFTTGKFTFRAYEYSLYPIEPLPEAAVMKFITPSEPFCGTMLLAAPGLVGGKYSVAAARPAQADQIAGYCVARNLVNWNVAPDPSEWTTGIMGIDGSFRPLLSAVICGIAGALYVPQVGIINPSEMSPANSIEIAIWTAVGGRGTLIGPLLGAGIVAGAKSWFTVAFPEYWLYFLGLLFILVTLFLQQGVMGLLGKIKAGCKA